MAAHGRQLVQMEKMKLGKDGGVFSSSDIKIVVNHLPASPGISECGKNQ